MSLWHITAKDLYLLVRDRRTIAVLLGLPLVFIVIIGMTTGEFLGFANSNQVLKIAAVDAIDYDAIGTPEFLKPDDAAADAAPPEALPESERQRQRYRAGHIVADVLNGIQNTPGVEVRTVADWRKSLGLPAAGGDRVALAEEMTRDQDVDATLVFRPEFYRKVYHLDLTDFGDLQGDGPAAEKLRRLGVEVVNSDPDSSSGSAVDAIVANHLLLGAILPIEACENVTGITARAAPKYRKSCGEVNRMGDAPPPELIPPKRSATAEGSDRVYQEIVPSYTVMFVFFLVNIMARSFLHERELGTLRRLRIAPIPPWQILGGKTLPFLCVSLVQTALLFLAGRLLFGMSWGNEPWMLLPVIFATSCAATGLGLMIATMVGSDSQVSAYATTAVIVLAGISGCFMPRKWLPDIVQDVSLATPHAWALIAYDQLLSSTVPNLAVVWQCCGALLAFAAVFLVIGAWRFRAVD